VDDCHGNTVPGHFGIMRGVFTGDGEPGTSVVLDEGLGLSQRRGRGIHRSTATHVSLKTLRIHTRWCTLWIILLEMDGLVGHYEEVRRRSTFCDGWVRQL
jgi:hypothetical protein